MVQLLNDFVCSTNYEAFFEKLISADWALNYFMNKTAKQKQVCLAGSCLLFGIQNHSRKHYAVFDNHFLGFVLMRRWILNDNVSISTRCDFIRISQRSMLVGDRMCDKLLNVVLLGAYNGTIVWV